jgi:hypothetical protein
MCERRKKDLGSGSGKVGRCNGEMLNKESKMESGSGKWK